MRYTSRIAQTKTRTNRTSFRAGTAHGQVDSMLMATMVFCAKSVCSRFMRRGRRQLKAGCNKRSYFNPTVLVGVPSAVLSFTLLSPQLSMMPPF